MAVSNSYLGYILDRLGLVGSVTARRMFGGVGIYCEGTFFALIDDDTLYFRVDKESVNVYRDEGMQQFRPFGEDSYAMNYYSVPERVLEDNQTLFEWMNQAVLAARKKKVRKK